MNTKKLLYRLIINIALAFGVFWLIFILPNRTVKIFDRDLKPSPHETITIEKGKILVNGEEVSDELSDTTYVFSNQELYDSYKNAINEVISYSNDVNIVGDATVYLKYLQSKGTMICVYSDTYRFGADGLNETTLVVDALNRILDIDIILIPVSEFTEDKGVTTVKELVESGVADLGVYPQFPFHEEFSLEEEGFKVSEPYAINKMYALSNGDDTDVDLTHDKVAIVNTIDKYDESVLGEDVVIVASKEDAVEMLLNYEIDHIVEMSSNELDFYIDNGLYMNIIEDQRVIGLSYLIATEEYAKELINIMNSLLSKESLNAIDQFGTKKYNYTTIEYLNATKDLVEYTEPEDGYIDLAFSEHIGLLARNENNVLEGYTIDILMYLSKALDINFRLHDYTALSYSDMLIALHDGNVDGIVDSVVPTSINNVYQIDGSTNTLPYLTCRFDIVMDVNETPLTTLDELATKTVGAVRSDADAVEVFLKYKIRDSGSMKLKVYNSYGELINALKKGEIQYAMAYPGFTKFIQDKGELWCVDAYNENTFRGFNSNDFYIQLRDDDLKMIKFATLLNRGISSITTEELKIRWFYSGSIFEHIMGADSNQSTLNILILIVAAVIVFSAIVTLTQQDKTEKYLNEILLVDAVTKFGNRYAYNQTIESAGVVYCVKTRIPNFKFLLSSMAEGEIEKLYETIANRISEYDKEYHDIKHFHFSEDEFIIVLPYDENIDINNYIEGLLSVLKAVYVIKDRQIEVKVQIVALLNELIYYDNSKLLMYCSSILDSNGNAERNSATVLTSGMLQRLKKVEILDELLNRELREILVPYYTPIYSVDSEEIIGVEMIGRMNTKNISISRSEYIDHVYESGLMGEVQRDLIFRMMEDREYLIKEGIIDEKFLFSFYAGEDLMLKYGDEMLAMFNAEGIYDFSFLQIMIPEYELAKSAVLEKIRIAQSNKMKIVVENFNVGHSSLGKIIALKLDGVKILHHVIDDNEKTSETSLFESLIKMVSEINVPINVADVENSRDYHYLLSNKVQYLQGSHFVRPLPIAYIKKYLEDEKNVIILD